MVVSDRACPNKGAGLSSITPLGENTAKSVPAYVKHTLGTLRLGVFFFKRFFAMHIRDLEFKTNER